MSENKLPEGFIKIIQQESESLQRFRDSNPLLPILTEQGLQGLLTEGAHLFASYIAKQEPVGKIIDGFFLSNDEAIGLYDKKGKVITPLYIHPSHLEEENKRLREALERVKKHLDTMTFHNTTAPTDDEGYEIYWIHKDKYDNIISIANNALNK